LYDSGRAVELGTSLGNVLLKAGFFSPSLKAELEQTEAGRRQERTLKDGDVIGRSVDPTIC